MGILNKNIKYYNVESLIEKYKSNYYVLLSGRDIGKSTSVCKYIVKQSYNYYKAFAFIRRYETRVADVKKWFNSTHLSEYYEELTGGEYKEIDVKADEVFFIGYDEKGKKVKGPTLGYVFYINKVKTGYYKSLQFDNVYKVVYEEFIIDNDDIYLPNEVADFENLLSTILRKRIYEPDIEIFLVGNKVNQICPYLTEYGINDALKLQPGEIKQYHYTRHNELLEAEDEIILTVEMIKDAQKGGISISKKGKQAETGEWVTGEHPRLMKGESFKDYDNIYTFIFAYSGFYFCIRCLQDKDSNIFLFCVPHTTDIPDNTRVIGDIPSHSILYTYDFTPIVNREAVVFNLIKQKKIYFSDNQCGTNFFNAYKALKQGGLR